MHFREVFLRLVQVPGIASQENFRPVVVGGHRRAVGVGKLFQFVLVVGLEPAGGKILRRFKSDRNAELGADAVGHHFKLQHSDHTDDPFGADHRFENAGAAFFGDLPESVAEVFRLQRIKRPHAF